MQAIFSSVDKCPNLLRLALRQLWLRVAERFKEPEHVVCSIADSRHTSHRVVYCIDHQSKDLKLSTSRLCHLFTGNSYFVNSVLYIYI